MKAVVPAKKGQRIQISGNNTDTEAYAMVIRAKEPSQKPEI